MSVQEIAKEAAGYFETVYRDPGDFRSKGDRLEENAYVRVRKEAPEWVTDMVRRAHLDAEVLPDDYRYQVIREAVEYIADADEPEEVSGEFADPDSSMPYNSDRLEWLASHSMRPDYCDQAAEEYGRPKTGGIIALIGLGIYAERSEIYHSVLAFLERRESEVAA